MDPDIQDLIWILWLIYTQENCLIQTKRPETLAERCEFDH